MVAITGSDFADLLNDTSITDTQAEKILDQSIDLLVLFGKVDLPNLSGTAGSKTLSVEARQRGAIYLVARTIYTSFYRNATSDNVSIQSISVSQTELVNSDAVMKTVLEAARQLHEFDWSRAII